MWIKGVQAIDQHLSPSIPATEILVVSELSILHSSSESVHTLPSDILFPYNYCRCSLWFLTQPSVYMWKPNALPPMLLPGELSLAPAPVAEAQRHMLDLFSPRRSHELVLSDVLTCTSLIYGVFGKPPRSRHTARMLTENRHIFCPC